MNIFEYFKASDTTIWFDEAHEVTYYAHADGVQIVPWDGSYKRWISKTWYE